MSLFSRWGVGASILMYHSIADNSDEAHTVSIDNFRKQVFWLIENGFEIISLSSLLKLIQTQDYQNSRKKVVITFDDGYQDFLDNAMPILLDVNATATIFLVTGMMGGTADWNPIASDVTLMTEDGAHHIKEKGFSLGSHTITHINLETASQQDLQQQLKESYDILTRLGETFYSLAYPWGQWSDRVVDAVKAAGFECAVAVGETTCMDVDNRYQLPRISITKDTDMASFQSLLTRTGIEKGLRRKVWQFRQKRLANPEENLSS